MVVPIARTSLPTTSGLFPKQPNEADYIDRLTVRVGHELDARTRDDASRGNILMRSPSGAVYSLYVNDLGEVKAARVSGG